MIRATFAAIGRHRTRWLAITLAWPVLYHALLAVLATIRFGALPNYLTVYDFPRNVGLIVAGTPALSDRLTLLAVEPMAELGYRLPQFGAEWSVWILPSHVLLQLAVGILFATVVVLPRSGAACGPARTSRALALLGGAAVGIGGATISWVVCCGIPTWVTILTMLGLNALTALAFEPYGQWLVGGGLALLSVAILWRTRDLAHRQAA